MLFMTGDQDFGSPTEGIRVIESKVRPIYALYGKETAFENLLYPGVGHVYLPEMWQKTMAWMGKNL
ncbi:MAG TPA: hypothetical protein VN829_01840, partial [Dongiaceae bacterium]|nr:hypothetical protein [Dongiaceae bacterium]